MGTDDENREGHSTQRGVPSGGCFDYVLVIMLVAGIVIALDANSPKDRALAMYLCAFPLLYLVVHNAVYVALRRIRNEDSGGTDGR